MEPVKIIIIGGNAAGPAAAAKAKRINPEAEVIMFEAGKYICTGTCEIPYVLSGEIKSYKDIVFFDPDSFFKNKNVKVYNQHLVEKIDRRRKELVVKNLTEGRSFKIHYDKLILTTGSVSCRIGIIPYNLSNVFLIKGIEDLIRISEFINRDKPAKVLIIGAGYIGLEMAEVFKGLGLDVVLMDKKSKPLPSAEPEIQHLVLDLLNKEDIEFLCGTISESLNVQNNKAKSIYYKGRIIDFDMLVVAVGFEPNNRLAINSGLEIGSYSGLKIDRKCRTSDHNIYAAGDNVEVINYISKSSDYIPLATIAHEYGHAAGENAAGGNKNINPVVKNIAVKIFNKTFVSVGLNSFEIQKLNINCKAVSAITQNLTSVMPDSRKIFGKLLYNPENNNVLGATFLGGDEVIGIGNLLSSFIFNNTEVTKLSELWFNFTPPKSPFINILSVLGRKIKS
ncbi:FAD-dependent oxidoreductase [Bacteroidota bacterium]